MVRAGSGPVDYVADRVQVIGVSLSSSGDEVDRSEVLDPLAPPRASVVLGRRMANVTIEQEVYGDLSQHAALFRACPVAVTQSSAGIAGAVSSSPSARGKRCTIEIVEVGGNRYRVEDALGVFTMSGAPGERLLLTFDLQGELVPVEDAGLAPMAVVMPPAPLVYRNASLLASEQAFATCPEFSFDAGMSLGTMDYTCSPNGGRASFVQRDAQAVLALTGVLSGRESIDRHWAAARVPVCGATLDATVWSDGVSSSVRVELRGCATVDPALAEVEGFAAYDLAVGAAAWSLVWDIGEGVPLPIELGAAVWLDPTDLATLFIDSAGTTPVQYSGDPVGLWRNKGTLGAVGDAAQPVSASRPVWTDAGGLTGFSNTTFLDAAGVHLKAPCTLVVSYDLAGSSVGQRLLSDSPQSTSLGGYRVHTQTGEMRFNTPPPSNRYSQVIGGDSAAFIGHIDTDGSVQAFSDVNQAGGSMLTIEPNWEGRAGMSLNSTSFAFGGTIKHVLVFDRVLSEVESTLR